MGYKYRPRDSVRAELYDKKVEDRVKSDIGEKMSTNYEIYGIDTESIKVITRCLLLKKSILFLYAYNEYTAYNIFMSYKFDKLGSLAFGGQPDNRVIVGVMRFGFFHFDLFYGEFLDDYYVQEKLGMNEGDAQAIGALLREIMKYLQGNEEI